MSKTTFHPISSSAGDKQDHTSVYFTLISDHSNASFSGHDHVILLTFDDNYVDQSINLILSILKYHPGGVSFLCLCPVLSAENQRTLLSSAYPIRLICYEHTPFISTRNWPACSIFRLFPPGFWITRSTRSCTWIPIFCAAATYSLCWMLPQPALRCAASLVVIFHQCSSRISRSISPLRSTAIPAYVSLTWTLSVSCIPSIPL